MRKLRVAGFVVLILITVGAWAYNLVPGLKVQPDPAERRSCNAFVGETGFYRWDITAHDWVCSDNWKFPGIHGV